MEINWQFMATKKFDSADFEGFLRLLPKDVDGVRLRHALEVRHPSSQDPRFYDLARRYNAAIVIADDDGFPAIDERTSDFTYARLMRCQESARTGYTPAALKRWARPRRNLGEARRRLHCFARGSMFDKLLRGQGDRDC